MPRLDDIVTGIARIDGFAFQDLCIVLLKKDYPNLNALPPQRDLGQDAVIVPFLSAADLRVSVAISKESNWSKLKKDCRKCKEEGHEIDVLVFATAGSVSNEKRQKWENDVRTQFGWNLVVHDKNWLRSLVELPDFEAAIETILGVPPPNGDFSSAIGEAVKRETAESLLGFSDTLPRVGHLERPERAKVIQVLGRGGRVLVRGDSGAGKSGLLRVLSSSLEKQGPICYIDSRRVAHIKSDAQLSAHFGLRPPFANALYRLAVNAGHCSLIVDQLESIGQLASAAVMSRLLEQCAVMPNVSVLTACRPWDLKEIELYLSLVQRAGFEVIDSAPLEAPLVRQLLIEIGVHSPSEELVELGRNLLHLSSIIEIVTADPSTPLSSLRDALALWDKYREVLIRREYSQEDPNRGKELVAAAAELAKRSLSSEGGGFTLSYPLGAAQAGLVSLGIVKLSALGTYHFRHDELRDYFYAWHASENRQLMPREVAAELPVNSRLAVFEWMLRIYQARYPARVAAFVKEAFGV